MTRRKKYLAPPIDGEIIDTKKIGKIKVYIFKIYNKKRGYIASTKNEFIFNYHNYPRTTLFQLDEIYKRIEKMTKVYKYELTEIKTCCKT